MIGEKINATGMTGFVNEERTRSQWGRWRREKSAYMLKCQVNKCMREVGRIFVLKHVSMCIQLPVTSGIEIAFPGLPQAEWRSMRGWLVVSPCRWWGLSALSQREQWAVGWWWCTREWTRWQGCTGMQMQVWIHTQGRETESHILYEPYTHTQKHSASTGM